VTWVAEANRLPNAMSANASYVQWLKSGLRALERMAMTPAIPLKESLPFRRAP